ncbi:hypothetical protein BKA81DRAFT_344321 [Phyllosticta paracitricarpa]
MFRSRLGDHVRPCDVTLSCCIGVWLTCPFLSSSNSGPCESTDRKLPANALRWNMTATNCKCLHHQGTCSSRQRLSMGFRWKKGGGATASPATNPGDEPRSKNLACPSRCIVLFKKSAIDVQSFGLPKKEEVKAPRRPIDPAWPKRKLTCSTRLTR